MIKAQATDKGSLYIVATPIGNKEDITLRALAVLKSVDLILAEDTRHSINLLNMLGIKNKLTSLHVHNEGEKSQQIIDKLLTGLSIALISDAGTPLISDPGFPLVREARFHQIPIIPIPGACALITALSAAGIACDTFSFLGFLPAKSKARRDKLESLVHHPYTLVFYESTHRIVDCLKDLIEVYGSQYQLVLAKELTKSYEQFIQGTAAEVHSWLLSEEGRIKGEFVLIIPAKEQFFEIQAGKKTLSVLLKSLPLKQAVSLACELGAGSKNELYELALTLKNNS